MPKLRSVVDFRVSPKLGYTFVSGRQFTQASPREARFAS